jgi:hypothetical protein
MSSKIPADVEAATAEVAEFVRQWKRDKHRSNDIYGVFFDPAVDRMVNLRATDLQTILDFIAEVSA